MPREDQRAYRCIKSGGMSSMAATVSLCISEEFSQVMLVMRVKPKLDCWRYLIKTMG